MHAPSRKERSMEPYQQRVIDEKTELDAKREKLKVFMNSEAFRGLPFEERNRLMDQANIMKDYSIILDERIGAFQVK